MISSDEFWFGGHRSPRGAKRNPTCQIFDILPVQLGRIGRAEMSKQGRSKKPSSLTTDATRTGRHPLFGALKGMTFVPPGIDLTEPADPDWGKVYDKIAEPEPSTKDDP
jgi:hypothetical protein